MYKIIIWGRGKTADILLRYLDEEKVDIVGFTDNSLKETVRENGTLLICSSEICNYEFDYVLIASSAYAEITAQLIHMGIDETKIKQVYEYDMYKNDEVIHKLTRWNFYCSLHEYEVGGV